jgi:hypothetical protein
MLPGLALADGTATESPATTEAPATTETPAATEEPAATKEPIATQKPTATAEAATGDYAEIPALDGDMGFVYELNADNTITVTGFRGSLTAGQDLAIPAAIDGKTVTGITGSIGNSWFESTTLYGTLTLPNTITTLNNFTVTDSPAL